MENSRIRKPAIWLENYVIVNDDSEDYFDISSDDEEELENEDNGNYLHYICYY
jgi:hypothetical protein